MAYEKKSLHDALMEAGDNTKKGLKKSKEKAEGKKS